MVSWTFDTPRPYSDAHLQKSDKEHLIRETVTWNPLPVTLPRPDRVRPSKN